jgi:hypothetical protein
MITRWLHELWYGRQGQGTSSRRKDVKLRVEELERREVPTTSPFLLDSNNQLLAANDAAGQTYASTGGYGIQLAVGEFFSGGGGGEVAYIRDGANRVYIFNGNNNTFTDTGAFAIDIVAGRGGAFFRDGGNRVYVLTLGTVNPNGTFAFTTQMTAGFAIQMSVGFDNVSSQDFLAYRTGDNSVHVLETVAGAPVYGASGAFAIDLEGGNEREIYIRDGNNQVSIVRVNNANAAGVSFTSTINTAAFAIQMSVGRGNTFGDNILAYRAGDNAVHYLRYGSAPTATVGYVSVGAFAVQVVAGSNEIFSRDFNNQVVYFRMDTGGNSVTTFATGAYGSRIEVTRQSPNSLPIDQLALLDGNGRLYVSVNTSGAGDTIESFFDTGLVANDVDGFSKYP